MTSLIRMSKREFFSRAISENTDNTYIWKHIKNINDKDKENKIREQIVLDGILTNSPEETVEKLITFSLQLANNLKQIKRKAVIHLIHTLCKIMQIARSHQISNSEPH